MLLRDLKFALSLSFLLLGEDELLPEAYHGCLGLCCLDKCLPLHGVHLRLKIRNGAGEVGLLH